MAIKVYISSAYKHGERWKKLEWSEGIEFTAYWVECFGIYEETPNNCKIGWVQNVEDIASSDVLVVYGGDYDDDTLRGSLVEVGIALAYGRKVIAVGDNPLFGSWQYHPNVWKVETLEEARYLVELMGRM